jgi:hypothetical protein
MAGGSLIIVGLESESSTTLIFDWPVSAAYTNPTLKITSTGVESWGYNKKTGAENMYKSATYTRTGTYLGLSTTSGGSVAYEIGDEIPIDISGSSYYLYVVVAVNETYLTSDIDLTSVANAIRTKGGTSASLVYPAGYISAINALPTGALQSYKSAVFTSPGSATLTPDSGYVGIEEISVEYSPAIYDGAYHTVIVYPVKGDVITLNMDGTNRNYRVLKISGSVAEVLAQFNAGNCAFASSGQVYAGQTLDTFLNSTWYNTCTAIAKAAIVDKTFQQDRWYRNADGSPDYIGKYSYSSSYTVSLENASFGALITRHVYIITTQDVIDYLEVTPSMTVNTTTLNPDNIQSMFNNPDGGAIRLCSANATTTSRVMYAGSGFNYIDAASATVTSNQTRPCFQIDLDKISWSFAS